MTAILTTHALQAQSNESVGAGVNIAATRPKANSDNIFGIDRWSFRVNALELLCTVPNVNAEFDISSSPYNRWTLGLTAKYNWNTWHSVPPSHVFNMFEVRPEFRKWFRMKPKEGSKDPVKERAYFIGGYVSGGTYSIKPGKYGIQGPLFSVGALFGYDFPLYTYRHFAIDFELGAAAGVGVTSYTGYSMNRSSTDFVEAPEHSKGWHVCPFPVLSEIKACLVFRTLSIKEKYKKVDSQKLILKQEAEDAKRLAAEKKAELKQQKKELKHQKAEIIKQKREVAEQQRLKADDEKKEVAQ